MTLGYIGLGKMGYNMVTRLIEKGYEVFAFDVSEKSRSEAAKIGAKVMNSAEDLTKSLPAPRVIWIMVPHEFVEQSVSSIIPCLREGDIVIDGGNSFYKDSIKRAKMLADKGIKFVDVGVAGGPYGARNGACLMIGGKFEDVKSLENLFRDLSFDNGCGYGHMGENGAGHFVKMIHNGIEYGMMQSIAEGFSIMRKSGLNLHLAEIADLYNHGSVVESRLVGWLEEAFSEFGEGMDGVSGIAGHSGEGEWTVQTAEEIGVNVPIIEGAVKFRVESGRKPGYTAQIISALRNRFGGHEARPA